MIDILNLSIEKYVSVQSRALNRLRNLGIKTVRDLLYHFPRRYVDYSTIRPIANLKNGDIATAQGTLVTIDGRFLWGKRPHSAGASRGRRMTIIEARMKDESGSIDIIWFNQQYLLKTLKPGMTVSVSGKVSRGKRGLYFQHPEHEILSKEQRAYGIEHIPEPQTVPSLTAESYKLKAALRHTGRLVPVYHETRGMTSRWLRFLVQQTLLKLPPRIPDVLPADIRNREALPDFVNSLHEIHFPRTESEAERAKYRFRFEELFLLQLKKHLALRELRQKQSPVIPFRQSYQRELYERLPFSLTNAQTQALQDILSDLQKPHPMNRLLNGDVGSGKTVVAFIAALGVIRAGFQVAFMAPTEILARQHFETFLKFFAHERIALGLLTSSGKKLVSPFGNSDKADIAKLIETGDVDCVFGTQSLIQDAIRFKRLGLVIVDEQHRFGVAERARLVARETTHTPHLLSMTATPIPRTLALTIYGDLDISVIDELPMGRKKVITKIVRPARRNAAYQFVEQEMKKGRQVFVICPRIGEDSLANQQRAAEEETKNVKKEFQKLSREIFPARNIAMIHGKLKPKEKEKIMRDFKNAKSDMLVATSVVEVGVDIPNATIMMIEGAETFGLASLHQFRGRVGRGAHQSFCLLFPSSESHEGSRRLQAVALSHNGFELAEKDLAFRGPGNLAGLEQSGFHAPLQESLMDAALVEKTAKAAGRLIDADPLLKKYPLLLERLRAVEYTLHAE